MKSPISRILLAALGALAVLPVAGVVYYESSAGQACARCHEISAFYDNWHASTHRSVECGDCHGGILTVDAGFHLGNLRRLVTHLRGKEPEQIRIKNRELFTVVERCQKCHQQEFADWQSGPHGISYASVFLDKKHNTQRQLIDDCLRCHGMHFEGGIRDLVTPVSTQGPWALKVQGLAGLPAIPCVSCHQIHREGRPLQKRTASKSPVAGPVQEFFRPSLALFDRRSLTAVPVKLLSLPVMREGNRVVKMSPDTRQSLCYQCHAPAAGEQVGSGDDRTGIGVHEGLSCLACHLKHGQQTRASCANCHPRLSNCGLDVEKMDTTFASAKSKHNIHFVKCADCHQKGVPARRNQLRAAD